MIAFDTESRFHNEGELSVQTWRTGSAIRWRNDLKSGDKAEGAAFNDPHTFWQWVTDYCRPGTRTVAWAHNLGHDVRIADVFHILPALGWTLDWCNLDRNVSVMSWRSARGTLVLCDTWTWIPLPLNVVAPLAGLVKFELPKDKADDETWNAYCMRDTEIVYRTVSALVHFIQRERLGNWQPTGAGMAYTTWRHRFMDSKVLVHDDVDALLAERSAMHTGRAEAWRHGKLGMGMWTEVDMRNAYLTIGAECELPRKLHSYTGKLSIRDYRRLASRFGVLAYCHIDIASPVVPCRVGDRFMWPVGSFDTWLWDVEIDAAIRYGATVRIDQSFLYVQAPILRSWALWVLSVLRDPAYEEDSIARTWIKHCSRALIGRLSLRTPSWEPFGDNPEGITGITHMTNPETGETSRLMHVGDQTLIETARKEGRDSLPQVTGKIMAICRVRLWDAMNAAGLDNIAHVDTDSLLVNQAGLARLKEVSGDDWGRLWAVKGTYRRLEVLGPRCYFRDGQRVTSGVPLKAEDAGDGRYVGERWTALSEDLEDRGGASVTTRPGKWTLRRNDPRRQDAPGAKSYTAAYELAGGSLSTASSMPRLAAGS